MGVTVELGDLVPSDPDEFGCTWTTVIPIDGWDGSGAGTVALTQKPRQNGAWVGPGSVAPREITLNGFLQAPDEDTLVDAQDRLNSCVSSYADSLFAVTRGSTRRTATVRLEGAVQWTEITDTNFQWSVPLVAPDPLKYGDPITASTGPVESAGGITWPITWPATWTGVTSNGTIHIDNPGKVESALIARVDGPCTGLRIHRIVDGVDILFALDYALAAGSYLLIDMANQTVLEGASGAPRMGFIASDGFFGLAPGANDFVFTADAPGGLLTLTASPAFP